MVRSVRRSLSDGLCSIVIAAFVTALLLPLLCRMRYADDQSDCARNMRQVAMACA